MDVSREWPVVVMHKREGTGGFRQLVLNWAMDEAQVPPWWVYKMPDGAPLELIVSEEEFAAARIGDRLYLSLGVYSMAEVRRQAAIVDPF